MEATKYTVKITVDALDMDSVFAKIIEAANELSRGIEHGRLADRDGDDVYWNTTKQQIQM